MSTEGLTPSAKKKNVALFLCCIGYIGVAGLHYFYTKRIIKGLVYLFTGGIVFIGTIIDTGSLLRNDFRDNKGAPLIENLPINGIFS